MTWPERRVARALSAAKLVWRYEWEAVLDRGNGYESVKYPDFYLPESDIYLEVLSLKPTPESTAHLRKKLEFYGENDLDCIVIDPLDRGHGPKSVGQLKAEIEAQVYGKAKGKYVPHYIHKRYIDDFLVRRDGYRKTASATAA